MLGFKNHYAATIFLHIPVRLPVCNSWVCYELNFSGFSVEKNSVTLFNFLAGHVSERHSTILLIPRAKSSRAIPVAL
jgi:hypothetical protein